MGSPTEALDLDGSDSAGVPPGSAAVSLGRYWLGLTTVRSTADNDSMGSRITVGCVFVLLLSAGCGGMEGNTPRSAAQRYEQAIVSKDGDGLCATASTGYLSRPATLEA